MTDQQQLRAELARRSGTNPEEWFLTFKARYGMEVVFREIAAHAGSGTVVTQLLTCVTAVTPILVGGLRPHYAPVSPDTLAINPAGLELPADTRAVVVQNTFGILGRAASQSLAAQTRAAGALLVEDSAHCVTRFNRGDDGAPLADVSIHSFGVEKMLPTKFGGAVWLSPALFETALGQAIAAKLRALPEPGLRLDFAVRNYRNQLRLLNRLPGAVGRPLRSLLTRWRFFEPAVAPVESTGLQLRQPLGISKPVTDQIMRVLPRLEEVAQRRGAAVRTYLEELGEVLEIPELVTGEDPLVRFPFLAPAGVDADELIARLTRAGIYAGRWYRPALFPGVADTRRYGVDGQHPADEATADVIARIVNLPTDVSVARAQEIAALVRAELPAS